MTIRLYLDAGCTTALLESVWELLNLEGILGALFLKLKHKTNKYISYWDSQHNKKKQAPNAILLS